jgi:hypothetical protein
VLVTERKQKNPFRSANKLFLALEHDENCGATPPTDQENYRLICWLNLNEKSFVKDAKDLKYYHHIFKITGKNDSFTFKAENAAKK